MPKDIISNDIFPHAGLWIRIRMDPRKLSLNIQFADPEPGGKNFQIKTDKMQGNW